MMHALNRRGTILLWCLAFSAFLTTTAFAFVRASHQHLEATSGSILGLLARQAANSGTAHAVAVICDDYSGAPTVPSNRFSPWMTAFRPFDLRQDNLTDYAIGFAGDVNEDDVKANVPLALPYFMHIYRGVYQKWDSGFSQQGNRTHPGYGRFLEPGYYASSQFYARSGVPSADERRFDDAAAGASSFPDATLWFDQRWRPVASRAEAAFRLRYACMIEDLSGHLLWNMPQAAYPSGLAKTISGPGDAGYIDETTKEFNYPLAQKYSLPFYNMAEIAGRSINWEPTADSVDTYTQHAKSPQWMTTFLGLGGVSKRTHDEAFVWKYVPATLTTNGRSAVDYDGKYPADFSASTGSSTIQAGMRGSLGAMFSWSQMVGQIATGATSNGTPIVPGQGQHAAWLWTPFGSTRRNIGTTQARASVDCPWQINPLTAAPRVLAAMITGLPRSNLKKLDLLSETLQENTAFGTLTPNWVDVVAAPSKTLTAKTGYPAIAFRGADLFVKSFTTNGTTLFDFPRKTIDAASNSAFSHFDYYPGPSWWRGPCLDKLEGTPEPYPSYPEITTTAKAEEELGKEFYMTTTAGAALTVTALDPMAGTSIPLSPPLGGVLSGPTASAYHSDNLKAADVAVAAKPPVERYRIRWSNASAGFGNSFWIDVIDALSHTLAVTRATWNPSCTASAGALTTLATFDVSGNGKIDTPEEMDRLFLGLLGVSFNEAVGTGATATIPNALYVDKTSITENGDIKEWKQHANIETLAAGQTPELSPGEGALPDLFVAGVTRSVARCLLMEKVVNDIRMSFFGANPNYTTFRAAKLFTSYRPVDAFVYNVDASRYSAYHTSAKPPYPAAATGLRTQARQASYSVDSEFKPLDNEYFSLTGYFAFGKSHFYRIITRGEVFSVLRNTAIAETNLETAVAIDPNADGDLGDSHVIYQNWHVNNFRGNRPSVLTP
jgi:hypothetical protein